MVIEVISLPIPKYIANSVDGLSNVFVYNPIALGMR